MGKIIGIDVSDNNGTLDWDTIKGQIDFAMIRVGYGSNYESQDDKQGIRNMQECERLGIPYGAYLYSYALDEGDSHSEAAHILRMIAGFNPVLGVYIDMEDADRYKERNGKEPQSNGEAYTSYCQIVMDDLKAAGFETVGTYANLDWFENILNREALSDKKWLAIWGPDSCPVDWAEIWQNSSDGSIDGSSERTDTNIYVNEKSFNDLAAVNAPAYEPEEPIPEREIEDVGAMYHEGDHVCYNRIYYTAGDWTDGAVPYYTDGVITNVYEGSRHPYLIGGGTGFVDDNCITGYYEESADTSSEETEETESGTEDVSYTTDGTTLELVERTMRGEFGDGDNRKNALGSRYDEVQSFINHIYAASAEDLANEVISGTYGNGDTRKTVLGDRYSEVQAIVNGESAKEYYTIKSGDTLSAIASAHDTTVDKLVALNGINNPDLIYAGTSIRVR